MAHYYWALSRLGARVPFHGPVERTVPREVVEQWIRELLDMHREHPKDTVYSLTQLARKTGLPEVPSNIFGPDKWGAITNNGLTGWVGPWGTSYASNLSPDPETGTGA